MTKSNKKINLAFALMVGVSGATFAGIPAINEVQNVQQDETCSGTVKDGTGEAVIGASVIVKGATQGTVTDIDGNFSLKGVKKGSTLRISYVGFETKEVVFNGAPLNITLKDDSKSLDEVVVTALGMKRSEKALGYAVTQVSGKDLAEANTISPVAALQGKVAGVQIEQSDGGMFGSTKIQIRGASTLKGNNQPIYVVDGVILDNSISDSGDADWSSNINDYGNELKNLNPDDFESVSVLKGAAATALYGSRGLNGAVVITTKSGKAGKGLGITFSQTFGIDRVYKTPDLQNEYVDGMFAGGADYMDGQNKWDAAHNYSKNSDGLYSQKTHYLNGGTGMGWGPNISMFDGQDVELYDGTIGRMSIYKNNYKDVYKTGFNSNTNFSVSGGNDRTTFYTSMSYKYASGITPENTFNRLSMMAKASHKLTKDIKLESSITFANSTPRNSPYNLGEEFAQGTWGRDFNPADYKNKYKGTHGGLASNTYGDEYGSIPGRGVWWSIYESDYRQKETSVRPTIDLYWDFTNWLSLHAGANYNYYYKRAESKALGSGYANEGGSYGLSQYTKEQTNAFAGLNVNKRLGEDFEIHGFLRGEYFGQFVQSSSMNTKDGLIVPGQYFINNSKSLPEYSATISGKKRMLSAIFAVGASWKDQLFLDITGRNDWSSSLVYTNGEGNYSYFYPSVSGSWLIHETFRGKLPSWISFAKLRASWAQVGNDTDPYYINTGYTLGSTQFGNSYVYSLSMPTTIKSSSLKPERKNAWEIGIDWRFLNNRIGIDATYYKENTKNQIMEISLPYDSGLKTQLINAGNIQNSGVEIALHTIPVQTKDWTWTLDFTYTKNDNKIVELSDNVANYILLDGDPQYGNYRIGSVAKVGGKYGTLMTDSKPKIDEKTGLPVLRYTNSYRTAYNVRSGEVEEIGSMVPDFLGSMHTTLTYKNWTLGVSMDARFGGYVASYNSRYATAYGYSGASLNYRNGMTWTSQYADSKGITYTDGFIPEGVFEANTTVTAINGEKVNVGGMTYQECYDKGILEPAHLNAYGYFRNSWGQGVINDDWYKKLNYIALREISLSYQFPASLAGKVGAKSLSLSLVGRNLGYLLNTAPNHENPESIRGTGAAQFRMRSFSPYTASYMFTINASF